MHSISTDQIKERAYFLAEARNFTPGYEIDDWLQAEKQLQAESSPQVSLLELEDPNPLSVRQTVISELLHAKQKSLLSDEYLASAISAPDVNFLYGQRVATLSEIIDSSAVLGVCLDKVLKLKPLSYTSRIIWSKYMGESEHPESLDDMTISLYIRLEILRALFGSK